MLDRLPRSRTDAATFTQVNPGERQEKTKGVRSDVGNEAKNMDTSESPSRITTQPVAASPTNKRVPSSMNMSTVDSIPSSLPSARSNSSQKTPTPRSTITVLIASSQTSSPRTSIISVPTGGTRVLPEASQSRSPDLSMQNITAITLSPTISGLPSSTPLIQGIALARPLPGKNQGRPILDAVAVPSYLELAGPESKSVPTISQTVVEAEYPFTSSQWSSSTSCGSNSTVLFMPVPTPTSFVTLTRDEQYKEQVSASFDATQDAPTPSAAKPTSILNPSALVTTLIAATPTVPLNVAASAVVNLQESRRLTPVTRTLFIVFGVLGKHLNPIPPACTDDSRCASITCCFWCRFIDASA
jgi:hypothetical protein